MLRKSGLVYLVLMCLIVVAIGAIGCGEATEETTTSETTVSSDTTTAPDSSDTTAAGGEESTTTSVASVDVSGVKMAINTYGTKTDGSWSESISDAYEALKEKYPDLDLIFTDNVPENDRPQLMATQASDGRSLIYCDSVYFPAIQPVAADHPDTWYVMPELTEDDLAVLPDNVTTYFFSYAEPCYLAGVAAGLETKTNTVAAILGLTGLPDLNSAAYAFFEGAKSVNPNVKFILGVTGDFIDVQKGYDQTIAAIDAGADVIMHFADNAGKGVIKAGVEKNVKLVGEAKDQLPLAPQNIITSYQCPHAYFVELALLDFASGNMSKGVKSFSMSDEIPELFGLYPLTNVSEETKAKVEEIKQQIIDGTLVVEPVTETADLEKLVQESK